MAGDDEQNSVASMVSSGSVSVPSTGQLEDDSDDTSPHSVTVLRTDTSWNGAGYESYPAGVPILTVMRYSIPPHSSLPWHEHPMPNAAFVISGSIILVSIEGESQVFRAGEAFAESVGDEHRGYTGGEGAEIVCTYAGASNMPFSTPTGRPLDK